MIPYMQGAQPYFFPGGANGVVLLHGLTASPAEPRWLGDHLRAAGFSVCGVRQAGHGTDHRALTRTRWEDWVASAFDGYHMLKSTCDRIAIIGHSMGGTVAMAAAGDERLDLSALVVLASPIKLDSPQVRRLRWMQYVTPFSNQADRGSLPDLIKAEQKQRGEPELGRVRYDIWATRAVVELVEVADYAYQYLPNITAPTLLMYSRKDDTIPYENMAQIQARIGAKTVETHTLEQSGHIIPQDIERDTAFSIVEQFLRRHMMSDAGAGG